MRRKLLRGLLPVICALAVACMAEDSSLQHGTIVRMRMTDCLAAQHGFMAAFSGTQAVPSGELCPEYVLLGDKVAYTIVGRSSNELLPLAEVTMFRFHKNEMLIRVDDAKRESRFAIKEMLLRREWERRRRQEEETDNPAWRHFDPTAAHSERQ
jgi:hypothetical protein